MGLGEGPPELEAGESEGVKGLIPLGVNTGVPQPLGERNSGELAYRFSEDSSKTLTSLYLSSIFNLSANCLNQAKVGVR